jgi:ABC-type transporter Mla subunit MlaD
MPANSAKSVSQSFADSGQVLDAALTDLPRLVANLQALLGGDAANLGPTIDNLSQVTGTIHQHLGDVATVLENLPDSLEIVDRATSYGQFVLVNAICISPTAPPCPTPVILAADRSGAGPVGAPSSFRSLLLGGAS